MYQVYVIKRRREVSLVASIQTLELDMDRKNQKKHHLWSLLSFSFAFEGPEAFDDRMKSVETDQGHIRHGSNGPEESSEGGHGLHLQSAPSIVDTGEEGRWQLRPVLWSSACILEFILSLWSVRWGHPQRKKVIGRNPQLKERQYVKWGFWRVRDDDA